MPNLMIHDLSKNFGSITVLHNISVAVENGEFFTLLGPSGCGKSTTLNCIAGLEEPSGGSIVVDETTLVDKDRDIFAPPEERNLGMVFQTYALWPHMTIAKNLSFPLTIRKVPRARQKDLIHDALDKVGLADLSDRYPHQLSGGQQQRVALARALVYEPTMLLLDEPLSNLDAKLREQARSWLKQLQEDLGITTIYVTHDQDEALALSDRIAVMSSGHMLQVAEPHEIYDTPATPKVAAFIGRCNFFQGKIEASNGQQHRIRLDCSGDVIEAEREFSAAQDDIVTLAVRPELLEAVPAQREVTGANRLNATVLTSSYVGSRYEYNVSVADQIVQVESQRSIEGDEVQLLFAPGSVLLYAGSLDSNNIDPSHQLTANA